MFSTPAAVRGAMDSVYVDFDTDYDLPECGFTREGYRFVGWSTSSYSTRTVTSINREYDSWDNDDGETYPVYAVWRKRPSTRRSRPFPPR